HAIAAAACEDCTIADGGSTKALILLPDMRERGTEARLPTVDHCRSGRPRAIIGDHHLEFAIRLAGERTQNGVERAFAIVGCDNERNKLSHVFALRTRLSYIGNRCPRHWRPPTENL